MRSFLRNRRFKNFAFKTDVLCSCLLLNSNAFPCYELNTDSERYKESFKKWYLNLPKQTFCAVNLNASWQCLLIGFKSDNEYGAFLRLQYGMEISKFCDILNGEFSFT